MDTPRDRYMRDGHFATLVNLLAHHLDRCDFTPTEVREAALLAAVIVETRKPGGPWVITREEADRWGIKVVDAGTPAPKGCPKCGGDGITRPGDVTCSECGELKERT